MGKKIIEYVTYSIVCVILSILILLIKPLISSYKLLSIYGSGVALSKDSAYVYSFNPKKALGREHFKPPLHKGETEALESEVLCPKSHKAIKWWSWDLKSGSEVPKPLFF